MKIKELLKTILANERYPETFSLAGLLQFVSFQHLNGIAVARDGDREQYLAFFAGEPEGAIYIDDNGTFYGDKAARLIAGTEEFAFYEMHADIIDALIMGCRIFDKTYIRTNPSYPVPAFGNKSTGIGVLTLTIMQKNSPENGIRVSIRKDGMIVGSDITTDTGEVRFRLMYGIYTCIVEDKAHAVTSVHIEFDKVNPDIVLNLDR